MTTLKDADHPEQLLSSCKMAAAMGDGSRLVSSPASILQKRDGEPGEKRRCPVKTGNTADSFAGKKKTQPQRPYSLPYRLPGPVISEDPYGVSCGWMEGRESAKERKSPDISR
jgi:hypothetical protein